MLQKSTDVLGDVVEGDAIGAGEGVFGGIVGERREDEDAASSNGIKESIRGFVIIAETVGGKVDDAVLLFEQDR